MKENELIPLKLKDGGVQLMIRKISPYLLRKVMTDFPEPEPPVEEVVYPNGETRLEPNTANLEYRKLMEQYNADSERRFERLTLELGVDLVMTDEVKNEVKELREFYRDTFEKEFSENDKLVYIKYIAVKSDADLKELMAAILTRAGATPEGVAQAQKSFPS